ncbi:non-ribosomal peptide synthetase [Pseudonocardia eucalypti]|uniref:Phenyloxazoline synthase MbtB n=1 Tax=Pseudonocardia eucalypti TaxID=648755 RepID=A0ABP9PUL2_9PSEU|nr:mycobactin phenyloxazoline synthetase [Pseudonocardia eucalypti]
MTKPAEAVAEELGAQLAELLEETPEEVAASQNLFELGLESISLMRLVADWRREGLEIDFAELAEHPTLNAWSALLAARRAGAASRAKSAAVAPEPVAQAGPELDEGEEFDLALMQHAYWVGRDADQRLGGVAAHLYTEFERAGGSPVDPERLADALHRLVARHDMLRVRVSDNGRQRIAAESGWRGLAVHDLREQDPAEAERELERVRDAYSHQMLDIEAGEVLATALSLLPDGRTRLHLDVDMVAADAVSYRMLLAELAALYNGEDEELPPIGYSYREYLASRPAARAEAAERAAGYWRARLDELPGTPDLPLAAGGPGGSEGRHPVAGPPIVVRKHVWLPADEWEQLAGYARGYGVTLAASVATAFAEVLGAWSGNQRFLLNVPMFDRAPVDPDVGLLIGDFTSSVLLAVDLTEPLGFAERVRATQSRLHADAAHADHSGVEVLRDLARLRGQQVLAPVVFTSALNLGELFAPEVTELFGEAVWIISQGPQVLLDAQVTEVSGGLLVNWDIRAREFAEGTVDAMFDAFAGLLRGLASEADTWTAPVGELLPADQREIRERVNGQPGIGTDWTLHQGFFELARTRPDAPAVLWGDGALSYGELAERALRVAGALAARGVVPGDLVGVSLPKGPDQVIAALGALAAGAAYVPVGIEQPPARAERIASVAGFRVLLDRAELAEALKADPVGGSVPGDPDRLAYVLFTSGSTGEPKGVEVPHRAAMATISDLCERYGLGPADRTLGVSALDFDLSVFDLFGPLSVGGAVVVLDEAARKDPQEWARLIAQHEVTVLNCVPQLLDATLRAAGATDQLRSLRVVLLGGDRVGVDLPGRLAEAAPGCRFVGLGGTTETAIHSTECEVDPENVPADWQSVPYGRPLRGVALRVVDELGRDCPDWVAGELWIGGDGVARGYRADPERTADRFVEHAGRRWYRTGDLARYRPGGNVEFLGRRDDQVKVRGFRVELGEVEAALSSADGVRAAAAALVGGQLGAGVELATNATVEAVKAGLADLLPPHMIPERVVRVDRLPLTANGKVDRKAVRALVASAAGSGAGRVAPRDHLEKAIALVWAETLQLADLDSVDVTQEFFAAGGDSLLATALVSELREVLDTSGVSVRMLFGAPTVAGLAERMRRAEPSEGRLDKVAEIFCEIAAMSDEEVAAALEAQS